MAQPCINCGAELFAGQRFCRACGATTDELSDEQAPTRLMSPPPAEWGVRSANTAPTPAQETSPVYAPPQYYQPQVPSHMGQAMPPYQPPRRRSPVGWILAFVGVGLFIALIVAVIFISQAAKRAINQVQRPDSPPEPRADEIELTSTNAERVDSSGNETTLTKTFALDDNAKFLLRNISGSIVVQAWDQPKAEIKVIKQGADRGARVFFSSSKGNLSIRSGQRNGGGQDVRYEIKLPAEIGRVTLNSSNGSIKLSGVRGQIFIEGGNGSIELIDVTGVAKVQTANGRIKAVLEEASDGPMEFTAVNGSIDLTVKSDFDADLDAATVHGSINIDEQFAITSEKEVVGQRARGQIGSGGQLLKIKTVNGSIKLSR